MLRLTSQFLPICFDQLAGSIRPHWEAGPSRGNAIEAYCEYLDAPIPDQPIAIHCHVYYLDLLPTFIDAWENIPNRWLLINTDTSTKARVIEVMLKARKESCYHIKICPNRGRDLAPMLINWRKEIESCELLIHCHTKKTPHADGIFGKKWRGSLLQATFPKEKNCILFQQLLQKKNAGLIFPWPHRSVAHVVNWGNNFPQIYSLMKAMGHEINRDTFLFFPAGSFFWTRVDVLQSLFNLELRKEDFSPEPIGIDGYLSHSIERCIGLLPMLMNRRNYAYWMSDDVDEIDSGVHEDLLAELPLENEVTPSSTSLFNQGMSQALASSGPRVQSIPLPRCQPRTHSMG
ncbi:Rhamnan synthesis protein F [Prochlorococcus marinus str. MIT 1313]|uniref:rhamnan synthesis F family protein n=1 Tax=Prochlorococcus TaxID=1218 RepID=UPI0007B35CEF|nr:rhamnan synthesis F family protein [Prochlorococcus marinus]KZR72341.1 Rhamnan synthesis protein F [Prochlorococcus marinus str. MIT 1313]KZR74066.1 Rhamnan synthesis protein F [Prochlorococcus marinus str. MIT 1318]